MTSAIAFPPDPAVTDHFVYLHGVGWEEYERLLAMRGDASVPRITYLKGEVELMSPSRHHENDKTRFARLLETWAEEMGVTLEGVGSWTLKERREERGAEPDECYLVGRVARSDDDRPDIAIEIVWTAGGIDKLEVYRKLRVREVWFYERGSLRFVELSDQKYTEVPSSSLLPDLDRELLVACMGEPSQTDAVRRLREELRRRG